VIAALFVDPRGPYANDPRFDIWDEERDARTYAGPHPVIAHPPCARWCRLAPVNAARWGAKIGQDGGTFKAALEAVRTYGGVLEHPAYSIAWDRYQLPVPKRGVWRRTLWDEGFVTEVSQSAYGHVARKRTWLYVIGDPLPMDWSDPPGQVVVGAGVNTGQAAGKGRPSALEAIATPPAFMEALVALAEHP